MPKYVRKEIRNGRTVYIYPEDLAKDNGQSTASGNTTSTRKAKNNPALSKQIGQHKDSEFLDAKTEKKLARNFKVNQTKQKLKGRVNKVLTKLRTKVKTLTGAAKKKAQTLLGRAKLLYKRVTGDKTVKKLDSDLANDTARKRKKRAAAAQKKNAAATRKAWAEELRKNNQGRLLKD